MTGINKKRKRIGTWLSRERLRNELYSLSDRSLQDSLVRYQPMPFSRSAAKQMNTVELARIVQACKTP